MHRRCADVMDLVQPDLVCPGHRQLIPWDQRRAAEYRDFIARKERVVRDLLDDPVDQGVDLWWARLVPYLRSVEPGESPAPTASSSATTPSAPPASKPASSCPDGWQTSNAFQPLDLKRRRPRRTHSSPPPHPPTPDIRRILTAELRINGQSQGPIPETLVTVTTP